MQAIRSLASNSQPGWLTGGGLKGQLSVACSKPTVCIAVHKPGSDKIGNTNVVIVPVALLACNPKSPIVPLHSPANGRFTTCQRVLLVLPSAWPPFIQPPSPPLRHLLIFVSLQITADKVEDRHHRAFSSRNYNLRTRHAHAGKLTTMGFFPAGDQALNRGLPSQKPLFAAGYRHIDMNRFVTDPR